ncbi:CUB domain-containing protein, partial [Pseudoalteromonas sp. BMB]|uniref:CUB domain-containing protein n=1 Tax=Pseudoalteromonas sp. BMB TaxID=1874619 RepID=UPI0034A0CCD5
MLLLSASFGNASSSTCGGNLVSESGSIKTPNFPGNYESNLNCVWKITVPFGSRVSLHFISYAV